MADIDQLNNVDNSVDLRISVAEISKIEQIKADFEKVKEWEAKIDGENQKILANREAEAKKILDGLFNQTDVTIDMKMINDPKNIRAMQTLLALKTFWENAPLKWLNVSIDWNIASIRSLFMSQEWTLDKWKAIDLLSMNIDGNFNKMLKQICGINEQDIADHEDAKKKKAKESSIKKWEEVKEWVELSVDNLNWAVNQLKEVVKTELKWWKGSFNQMKTDLWEDWLKAAKIVMFKYLKDNWAAWDLNPDFNTNDWWTASDVVKAFQKYIMENWSDANKKLIKESWKVDWKLWFNTFTVLKDVSQLKDVNPEEKAPELKSNAESKEVWLDEMPKTIPDFIKALWSWEEKQLKYNSSLVLEDGGHKYVRIGNERYAIDETLDGGYKWKWIRTKLDGSERVLQIWTFSDKWFEWKELREQGDKKTEMIKRTREDNSVLTVRKFKWDYDENWDYKGPWRFSIREVVDWNEEDTKRLSNEQLKQLMEQPDNVAWVLDESIKAFASTERQPSSVWRYNLNRIVNLILKDKDVQKALIESDSNSSSWERVYDLYKDNNPFETGLPPKETVQRFFWLEYWMLSNPKHKINFSDMTKKERDTYDNRKKTPWYERPRQWDRIQERLWELAKIYKKVKLSH